MILPENGTTGERLWSENILLRGAWQGTGAKLPWHPLLDLVKAVRNRILHSTV